MSFVNKTNSFFGNHVYFNLAKFAVLPVSWIFQTERTEHGLDFPDLGIPNKLENAMISAIRSCH